MAEIVKGFLQGTMNKDADERLLPEGQYRDAVNIEVYNQEGSSTGSVHNKLGNTKIADLAVCAGQPTTTAKTIGAVTYEANNLIYWLVASDKFDGIYEFNTETNTITRIIQSNKANPSAISKLNFRKEYPITGINYIPGRDELNNYLYWTDDYNPPRRVNISRVKTYSIDDDRIDNDLDVIVKPPLFAPAIYPYIDTTDPNSNNMKEKFLTFAYRWKYKDNQYSALSPFSAVAFTPGKYVYDYGIGNNKSMTNEFNAVKIVCESGNELVDEIQIVVKDTKSPNVKIVETISKENFSIADNSSFSFDFKNNKTYAVLPIDQVTRLFDNVPLLAKSQDVIGNRLAYGNYTQFRNISKCNGDDVFIDIKLDKVSDDIASPLNPKQTWRSDRDIEAGIIYGDDNGRMTTVLTSKSNSVYIPDENSVLANKLKLQINNQPPCWATNYRIVIKQPKGDYYTIFPIIFYANGVYRYLLIHDSDKDKVKVGDYIIIKSNTVGATKSNKKYKILELEDKVSNFISGNPITEFAGLYIKIKTDQQSELNPSDVITYDFTGQGTNLSAVNPVAFRFPVVENPIHYGIGDPLSMVIANGNNFSAGGNNDHDWRLTFEILSQTEFRYTADLNAGTSWVYRSITAGPIGIELWNNEVCLYVQFNTSQTLTVGDRWKVSCRTGDHLTGNYFGGVGLPGKYTPTSATNLSGSDEDYFADEYGGGAIVTANWYDGSGTSAVDKPIYPGAVIKFEILEDSSNPSTLPTIPQFFSPSYYENIEEWFIESGAWQQFVQYDAAGNNIGAKGVTFRRGVNYTEYAYTAGNQPNVPYGRVFQGGEISPSTLKHPVHMIIQGFAGNDSDINRLRVNLKITQQEETLLAETVPSETDLDIYHEVFQTHEIVNGKHTVLWNYDDYQFYNGNTKLTQLTNGKPHYFEVGHSVTIESANINGTYNIIQTDNQHSIVIDLAFPVAGPAIPGKVKFAGSLEQDQNGSTPAIIEINKPQAINSEYNAWTFGNGIESDRILDDWNETTKEFSVRAYTPFEGYGNVRNEASICYSGIYSENSSLNRLNEFNLSTANFKHLEKAFGSIQKLDARDTNLTVLQENKVSSVLYGKNILFDSTGGGQVASIPEVLGTQIPSNGEYGISKNPESFAKYGDYRFFTDARNGAVLMMDGNSDPVEISASGMTDFFRDLMTENPTTEKLGCFDPHNKMYILASTEQEVIPCKLDLSRTSYTITKDAAGFVAFSIVTDGPWTITRVDIGSGINWVTGYTQSGIGSQNVYVEVAANTTLSNRTIKFVVTYCDGLTQDFILTQARGRKGKVIIGVLNNDQTNSIKV